MNIFLRVAVIVFALATVGLTVGFLQANEHAQEMAALADKTQAELQKLKIARFVPSETGDPERLRMALNDQESVNEALRQEISRLKSSARAARRSAEAPAPAVTAAPAASTNNWSSVSARMEQLRQQDPERFQQVTAGIEQWRKQAEERYDTTMSQLDQRIQNAATPAEADLVTQISDTMTKLNDLRQQLQSARDLPPDQAQAAMAELFPEMQATTQQLNQLRDQDRKLQMQNLATQLGLKGDAVQTFPDSVTKIYSDTQYGTRGMGGGGGQQLNRTAPTTTSPSH